MSTPTFMQTDKVMETRSWVLDMYNNGKIRPARCYKRFVFFTSNCCHLHAPCSLTHGYLMSTTLCGNLICWTIMVNKKTSHQTSTLHVVWLWFDLIQHSPGCVSLTISMFLSACTKFLCESRIFRHGLNACLNVSIIHNYVSLFSSIKLCSLM